jgi:selenocysteine lyase/cysteine desulfurase
MKKRDFIKKITLTGFAAPAMLSGLDALLPKFSGFSAQDLKSKEAFWDEIRAGYRLKSEYINLESGYYSILPQETLNNYINHIKEVNFQGSYYMRKVQFENRRKMAAKLADLLACSVDEVGITRNTTESLDLIIAGFPWNPGDEALMADQDYGTMLSMFKMMESKHGIKANRISIPNIPASDDEIVSLYENALSSNTKLLMISHVINISGQILPVRKICDMAHRKGVKVMVDGAHAVGQFPFKMPDLHCDYYGASLHKWLSVPLGAGLLYVKKENIKDLSPLLASFSFGSEAEDDIRRLNHIGTHPVHTELAVADAIDFYLKLGPERKAERLKYLQLYWTDRVRDLPHIVMNTPRENSCAIANVGIKGMEPSEMAKILMEKYKIWTVAINNAGVSGCRITPNVFTTTQELDVLINALKEMV